MDYKRKSVLFQVGLLLTFLLPFYHQGCQDEVSKENSVEEVSIGIDSISLNKDSVIVNKNTDSIVKPIVNIEDNKITSSDLVEKENTTLYEQLLKPNGNHTGIAYILEAGLSMLIYSSPLYSFIFLIFGLVLKFRNFNLNFKWINLLGFLFHLLSPFLLVGGILGDILWGYYICTIWWIAMLANDYYILNKNKII